VVLATEGGAALIGMLQSGTLDKVYRESDFSHEIRSEITRLGKLVASSHFRILLILLSISMKKPTATNPPRLLSADNVRLLDQFSTNR
jgi:hypothetical protein